MEIGVEDSQRSRTIRYAGAALVACVFFNAAPLYAGDEAQVLAPSGHLRVGVYMGSPTSMVTPTRPMV